MSIEHGEPKGQDQPEELNSEHNIGPDITSPDTKDSLSVLEPAPRRRGSRFPTDGSNAVAPDEVKDDPISRRGFVRDVTGDYRPLKLDDARSTFDTPRPIGSIGADNTTLNSERVAVPGYIPQEPVLEPKPAKGGVPAGVKIGAAVAGVAAIVGGWIGYNKFNGGDDDRPGIVVPITTEVPSSETPSEEPSTTPSEVPTEEPTAESPLVSEAKPYGYYETIDDHPELTEVQKNKLKEILADSEIQIMTNRGLFALENGMATRETGVMYTGETKPTEKIESVLLRLDKYPDAAERFDKGFLLEKYNAVIHDFDNTAIEDMTFEEFKTAIEEGQDFSFTFPARYEGEGLPKDIKIPADAFVVKRLVPSSDDTMIWSHTRGGVNISYYPEGIIVIDNFSISPASLSYISPNNSRGADYALANEISIMGAILSAQGMRGADWHSDLDGGKSINPLELTSTVYPVAYEGDKEAYLPIADIRGTNIYGGDGILSVVGTTPYPSNR